MSSKMPLVIFKREKDVARRLEFDGIYVAEQPEDDDIKAHWDKLVISAKYDHVLVYIVGVSHSASVSCCCLSGIS